MQPQKNPRFFFVFFRGDESSLSVWGSLFTLLQIRALRLVRHLVAVSELPQPEGKQEWCHIAELYRSYIPMARSLEHLETREFIVEEVGLRDWKVYSTIVIRDLMMYIWHFCASIPTGF